MARVLVRVYHFNSHLREETNKNSISPQQNKKYFNSRLREETNRMISFALCHICNFNSRLRKETNTYTSMKRPDHFISTHVSARRRTISASALAPSETVKISIHVSARRRTDGIVASIAAPSFQLTSPRGDKLQILVLGTYSSYFNSHPRKETNIKFHCHLR